MAQDDGTNAVRAAGQSATEAAREGAAATSKAAQQAMQMGSAAMGEFTRLFSEMKMPMMPDMEMLLAAHRRNVEVLSAANRVALEGAQVVARRHMEIMQQSVAELSETMRQLAANDTPQAKAAHQADMLKKTYERAVANMRELSDLIQKANGEAVGLLNQRFIEAMDEVKVLMEKAERAAH